MPPISTTTIPDAEVDLEDLVLDNEYRVLVAKAAKHKAEIHRQLCYHESRVRLLKKRLVDADSMLTRTSAG